ncbi:MAG: DUF2490 domain-containing protein [Bacteroidota bacterium]
MTKKIVFISIIVVFSGRFLAQSKDFGLWTAISLEKNINTRFSLELTEALRLNENVTQIAQHYSQLAASYKIDKGFYVTLAYRNSQKFKYDETVSYRNRLQIGLSYKFALKNLGIEFQERFQSQIRDINRRDDWKIPKNYLRTRLTLTYDLNRKIEPFVSGELFYELSEEFDNYRLRAGFSYEINKFQSIKSYYMLDQEIQVKDPNSNFVLGFAYKYSF